MPPINCTSKWRMPVERTLSSLTIANASGKISSRTALSRRFRSSLSFVSPTARWTCSLKKAVRARNSASESFWTDGSRELILSTSGIIDLRYRWLLLPNTLVRNLSKLITVCDFMLLNARLQLLLYHFHNALPRHREVHHHLLAIGSSVCILHQHFFIFSGS